MWKHANSGRWVVPLLLVSCIAACAGPADPDRTVPAASAPSAADASATDRAGMGAEVHVPPQAGADAAAPLPFDMSPAKLRKAAMRGVLDVQLADGTRYPVRMLRARAEPGGRVSLVGRVAATTGHLAAVLTHDDASVFGVLPTPDGRTLSITTIRGVTRVAASGDLVVRDAAQGRSIAPDFAFPPAGRKTGRVSGSRPIAAVGQVRSSATIPRGEARIEVLGLYSDRLLQMRGSLAALQTEVVNMLAIATQAHIDSGSRARFHLAGMRQVVDDPEASDFTQLMAFTGNTGIEGWRDELGADLVVLVRPSQGGECGSAWVGGAGLRGSQADAGRGYAVVDVAPCSPYAMAHELGHSLGAMHGREDLRSIGMFSLGAYGYSFAYRRAGPAPFATLMASPEGSEPRIAVFSNPDSMACGAPCGVDGGTNNARTVDRMAAVVAGFRGKPGTLSVADNDDGEPVAGETVYTPVHVRITGKAPPGGVSFTIVLTGGTATPGVDFEMPQGRFTIPEGQSEAEFLDIAVIGDDQVEGDEYLTLRLQDVTGVPVDDGEATVVIRDDDPRPMVTGWLHFPEGMQPPAGDVTVGLSGMTLNGSAYAVRDRETIAAGPGFAFAVPAEYGTNGLLGAALPKPFLLEPVPVYDIIDDVTQHLYPIVGARVHGRMRVPEGGPALDGFETLEVTVTGRDGIPQTSSLYVQAPDYAYELYVVPGTQVDIRTGRAITPYKRYWKRMLVEADTGSDVLLSELPSLVAWSERGIVEGGSGEVTRLKVHFDFSSAPAPGTRFSYRTRSVSATAGSDFGAISGSVTMDGVQTGVEREIDIYGDRKFERQESFEVVLEGVEGAVVTSAPLSLEIWNDDGHTGGPGQVKQSP